ncbi:chromatin-remodeling ATPase INO80-like [Gigantopelta aegis]|uniref:chromatin-remodeling ATPase INO80-like n=1 Tax=Gigantopelta aegis TaxID=1735272 RepID=UPI001B88AE37|nr:chromatin-remodeling ATPase INO80-like [Gigantopelta aegis]
MSTETSLEHNYGQQLARPLHIQSLERALALEPLLGYVENLLTEPVKESDVESTDTEVDVLRPCLKDEEGNKILNGITITKAERKADKTRLFNFSRVKRSRKWLKNILLSDSSSDEDEDKPITNDDFQMMLQVHEFQRKHQKHFYQDPVLRQYRYYSTGLLSNYDKYPEHFKSVSGPRKKISKEQKKLEKKVKAKLKKLKKEKLSENGDDESVGEIDPALLEAIIQRQHLLGRGGKHRKLTPEQADAKRKRLWINIAKKEIPKAQKQKASARKEAMTTLKKVATQCMKECRRAALQSQKVMKEVPSRARRLTREMLLYWKRFEKVEKEHRRKVEKEALEQRKMDLELREARRQQRKINFLITQTEVYAHFMARKLTGENDLTRNKILGHLDEDMLAEIPGDDYDCEEVKMLALRNAEKAYTSHQRKTNAFDDSQTGSYSGCTDDEVTSEERPQPSIFQGTLKGYQLKGMNWLANLYNQGINGILADEMGLGKTIQSLAFLAHLAESQSIWGPFLVIAPASTLHNWQQESARFVSKFKIVPYWGNAQDRRILRKFWDQHCIHTEEASFHIVITSYQLVIQDVKYFQRIKWQYMILDEAQALKSSSSVRWKILLGFNCRNRLLLTGTPIQNSMAELWALLHFIMPTLFDSHDEFNEWFSKDIESHAEKQSGIDENQLSRLHMILKPFMLRRIKKDVENELSDKIEILVYCPLTTRQKRLYQAVKNKISIEDLLQTALANNSQAQTTTSSLMNLVMQFRKVCNHPDLFERREPHSAFFMNLEPYIVPKHIYRNGILSSAVPSKAKIVYNMLYIHSPDHVHRSLFPRSHSDSHVDSCFSFLRFINISPADLYAYMGGLLARWLAVFLRLKEAYRIHHNEFWHGHLNSRWSACRKLLLQPLHVTSFPNIDSSPNLHKLIFTSYTSDVVSHESHVIHYMKETTSHQLIRLKHLRQVALLKRAQMSPPQSPTKFSPKKSPAIEDISLPIHPHKRRPPRVMHLQPTCLPTFVINICRGVRAPPLKHYTCDRSAAWTTMKEKLCGSLEARNSLLFGTQEIANHARWASLCFTPPLLGGLAAHSPKHGFSGVSIPDKESLVSDAGKLSVLDSLLQRLKNEGHRILIYSQMTRMIDLLEEYMWHRKHTYMRLDGSSKISDRRDMVADFQTRSDIFVFLLSTRAGGLGINLTAADTVIFYDSDWNPTVDQQAMDRAHRLGQTKQVTVYRLICKGTIEERILQRAKEKSEIQRMVISGGNFRPDTLKPKEVVSLLIDDDEMETKLKFRQDEKRKDGNKEERKRKREYKKREGKKSKIGESNITIPAPDTESVASHDSYSVPASPQSVMSFGSEALVFGAQEDSSNDGGLVIVDDAHNTFPPVTSTPKSQGKRGRSRGRPRGTGVGRRPRGRGSKKLLSAAEIHGAQAGMNAAYAAYGYSLPSGSIDSPCQSGSLPTSGRNTPT